MGKVVQISSRELLTCFFEECEVRFNFLERKHGFSYISGLVSYKGGRQIITPYKNQDALDSFWATTRYEKDNDSFEIVFADGEFRVEGFACYNRIDRFAFTEILRAAKKPNPVISGNPWVQHREAMQETIQQMADSFKGHAACLLDPGEKLIDRAYAMRAKQIERQIRNQYKADVKSASTKAAKAFRAKDFREVIELLSLYEKDLGPSDRKKLEKARKSFRSQS